MASTVGIPELPVREVDQWMLSSQPSVDVVAERLAEVRRLVRDARVVEERLVGYAREVLNLDDAEETPDLLLGEDFDDE